MKPRPKLKQDHYPKLNICHCRRNKEDPAALCFLSMEGNIADVCE